MSNETSEKNDVFSTVEETTEKQIKSAEKSFPNYQASVTSLQQEYTEAIKNVVESNIALQREFADKTGINTALPEATENAVRKSNEQISKVQDVQNKIALATIDAASQNIKTFNENAKAFADLNKSVMQSWITAFTPKFS
jgi:predicted translin family RNA/ssDNA-binding protein